MEKLILRIIYYFCNNPLEKTEKEYMPNSFGS